MKKSTSLKKRTSALRKSKSAVKHGSKSGRPGTRPVLITVLCVLAWVGISMNVVMNGVLLAFPSFFRWFGLSFPVWYTLSSLLFSIINVFVWIAIWNMRKKGIIGYVVMSILGMALSSSQFSGFTIVGIIYGFIINIIVLILLLMKYKEMR